MSEEEKEVLDDLKLWLGIKKESDFIILHNDPLDDDL